MIYLLYNSLSNNCSGEAAATELKQSFKNEAVMFRDIKDITDFERFFEKISIADRVIIAGGDGTLNHFINDIGDMQIKVPLYLYATGSGNDFIRDTQEHCENGMICINEYIQNLPKVTVNGKTRRFINGVGYGIDGYCCEKGDLQCEKSAKPVNYTAIAIKGLLFFFKPSKAKITVDGVTKSYKKVWLAPTMKGRFYGGGMMIAPNQDRMANDKSITSVVLYGSCKLKTLIVFPTIFKGEHVKHREMVEFRQGKKVTVMFDRRRHCRLTERPC